jgi:CubicO group peptidase (beta-lactamase class C family)
MPSQAAATRFDEIDAYVQRQTDRLNIPGAALAIVEGDQMVHFRGFGRARPGGGAPAAQTPFVLGSITKSFTALAVMQLVEAGKVELDAPIQRYLPRFRVADLQVSAQISVRHLLNQTSGLSQMAGVLPLADFDDSPGVGERQARALAALQLTHPVGSAFEYSNMNYNLLGLIVEAVSGESYAAYVRDHIFAPLEMRHSYPTRTEAMPDGLAVGHRYWFALPIADDLPLPRGSLPSGQLISSAEDMSRYLSAHLNEGRYGDVRILSPAGMDELHRPAVEGSIGLVRGRYAMGWLVDQTGPTRIDWHEGTVPDYFSYMAILPEQRKGVVLLLNANQLTMNFALHEVGAGVGALLGGNPPAPTRLDFLPWVLRGLLLIPVLQLAGVAATLRLVRRWRRDPDSRPRRVRKWLINILLPLIPNLLVVVPLIVLLGGGLVGFTMVFLPDLAWLALLCGSFALVWIPVRTGLILWALHAPLAKPTGKSVLTPQTQPR